MSVPHFLAAFLNPESLNDGEQVVLLLSVSDNLLDSFVEDSFNVM